MVRRPFYLFGSYEINRMESEIEDISDFGEYDVIIASDCLYFPSQEDPLVAVLQKRLRQNGAALLIVQERSNGGCQVQRLVEKLMNKPTRRS